MTDLRNGWPNVALGSITWPTADREVPDPADDRPYLSMDGVQSGTGNVTKLAIAGHFRSVAPRVEPGYVLYGRLRPYLNKVAEATFSGYCSGEFICFPPRPWLTPRFLQYRLLAEDFVNFATNLNTGDRPRVKWEQIADFEIALPSVVVQQRIVATLDDHLSRLRAAAVGLDKTRLGADRLNLAIANSIVLGSQLSEDFSDTVRDRDNSSARFNYSMLPRLPRGWSWRAARDICMSIFCGSTPKSHLMKSDWGEVPFIKVYNLTMNGGLDYSVRPTFINRTTHEGLLRRSRVKPGDVLTNIVGPPLGKTAVVPESHDEWNINQAIVAFRAGRELDPSWLALALKSPFVIGLLKKTAKATAGQFNVSLSTCRDLPLPVPSLSTQRALLRSYDEMRSEVEESIRYVAITQHRVDQLRRSLLAEAFAGRLVPQDPEDEAAVALLEWIKGEQAVRLMPKRVRRRTKTTNFEPESTL